jgi:uncharacterized membrane protein YgcG
MFSTPMTRMVNMVANTVVVSMEAEAEGNTEDKATEDVAIQMIVMVVVEDTVVTATTMMDTADNTMDAAVKVMTPVIRAALMAAKMDTAIACKVVGVDSEEVQVAIAATKAVTADMGDMEDMAEARDMINMARGKTRIGEMTLMSRAMTKVSNIVTIIIIVEPHTDLFSGYEDGMEYGDEDEWDENDQHGGHGGGGHESYGGNGGYGGGHGGYGGGHGGYGGGNDDEW